MKKFKVFEPYTPHIFHAVYTRATDIYNCGLPGAVMFDEQEHGTRTVVLKEVPAVRPLRGDALATQLTDVPLIIRIADCASIILYDPTHDVIANIHAGWRGLAKRIIRETIGEMTRRFSTKPADLIAGVSPMIGPCCAEFSDPLTELPKHMHRFILEENKVDLWGATEGQLIECGLTKEHIENMRLCTACNPEEFYSYRRDPGSPLRFGTAIMLNK